MNKSIGTPTQSRATASVLNRRAFEVSTALGVFGVGALAATVLADWSPLPRLAALQGALPVAALAVAGAAVVAAALRSWRVAMGAGAVLAMCASVLIGPMTADAAPAWTSGATTVSVYGANLWGNVSSASEAFVVAEWADADIVFFSEYSHDARPALEASGLLEEYPHVVETRRRDGNLLLSRLPIVESGFVNLLDSHSPSVVVEVDGRRVQIIGVHLSSPTSIGAMRHWAAQGIELERVTRGVETIAFGDFNSTPWNSVTRSLQASGFVDAHDAVGSALARTWGKPVPVLNRRVAVLGIDRAMSRGDGLAPLSVTSSHIPGSDHDAVRAVFAVRSAEE